MSTTTLNRPTSTVPAQRRGTAIVSPAVGGSAPQAARAAGSVRLTRRGRLLVTLVLLAVVTAAFTFFSSWSSASGEAGAEVPTRIHVVSEGDTLWAIASEIAEPGEIREVVHRIEKMNSLPGPSLVEGQELAIPVD